MGVVLENELVDCDCAVLVMEVSYISSIAFTDYTTSICVMMHCFLDTSHRWMEKEYCGHSVRLLPCLSCCLCQQIFFVKFVCILEALFTNQWSERIVDHHWAWLR